MLQISDHMLVGLSARTNAAAADQLRSILACEGDATRVHAIDVPHGLHLKSACSALDHNTLLLSDNPAGRGIAAGIKRRCPELAARLEMVYLPGDPLAANVLRIGGHMVMQRSPSAEGVLRALCEARGLQLHVLPRMTEVEKADGALTCCSILIA